MKKFFLIPLLACSFCAMAFATVRTAGSYAELTSAIAAAQNGDEIQLTNDISYGYVATTTTGTNAMDITKSITIDGQGHTLTGSTKRASDNTQCATLLVNVKCTDSVSVVIKNIKIVNHRVGVVDRDFVVHTRGKLKSIELDNVELDATAASSHATCLQIGGNQYNTIDVLINNSKLTAGASSYAFSTWNRIDLETNNSQYSGYCSMYFHNNGNYTGTALKRVRANNCEFDAPNVHSGSSDNFGVFAAYDHNIKIYLHNCGMNAKATGTALQAMLTSDKLNYNPGHVVKISGDNSHINGLFCINFNASKDSIEFAGGTYSVNPEDYHTYYPSIYIAEGYTVKEITTHQGDQETTLYRVRKDDTATKEVEVVDEETGEITTVEVAYGLNELVEGEGESAGNNPTSSFEVATGDTVSLDNETTTAGYIQLQDNVTVDPETQEEVTTPTVIQVGKTETNEQTGEEEKVDQTLVVNNGLDIQGESQLVVQAGSAVIVGEGGIITENEGNIVLEANEEESVAFLLAPEVVVNTTPLATYKFKSKARFHSAEGIYTYQRFGVPTFDGLTTMTWEANVLTSLDRYSNENRNWEHINPVAKGRYEIAGKPFQCYNMTIDTDTTDITYTFTGNLMGNQNTDLDFVAGWNCYANCYTAPINTASLLRQIDEKFGEGVNGAIYIYKRNEETNATDWEAITLGDFDFFGESYLEAHGVKEIAPMQAFILNLHEGESAEGTISYVDNIYNPYMNIPTPEFGHAPKAKTGNNTGVVLYVSDGTNSDKLTLYEKESLSDEFDNGYDADKFDNEFDFSVYCMLGETKLSALGTNSLADKNIAFDTKVAGEFTLSVEIAVGDPVILYDNVEEKTLELTTGASFTFSAQAINDPARFTINPSGATAIDNTEVVGTTSKFIKDGQLYIRRAGNVYTVQGQTVK